MVAEQALTYFGNDDPHTLTHSMLPATLAALPSATFTYAYDRRHQLTGVTTDIPGYFNATYGYGDAGRFQAASEVQTFAPTVGSEVQSRDVTYVYGDVDPERVTALNTTSDGTRYATFAYDEAGNTTWKCMGAVYAPTCTGESFDYVYDGQDRLRRATRKLNGVVTGSEEYWYDKDGQRVSLLKRDAAGTRTELVWFLKDTEAHYDGDGTVTHVYSHVTMGTPVARIDRTADNVTTTELQFHGLGNSTLAAVGIDGTVNASFRYGPFGEVLEATDGGGFGAGIAAHKRRFNDKQQDDLTSLTYYGARYYDKTLLLWTQADPQYRFAPDAAWNSPRKSLLYTADLNNPVRYSDPDGRSTDALPMVFAAAGEVSGAAVIVTGAVAVAVVAAAAVVAGEMAPIAGEGASVPENDSPLGAMRMADRQLAHIEAQQATFKTYVSEFDKAANQAFAKANQPAAKPGSRATFAADDAESAGQATPLPEQQPGRVKAKDRRAAEQARSKEEKFGDADYEEPASEEYAKYLAEQAEKARGKDARRQGHDQENRLAKAIAASDNLRTTMTISAAAQEAVSRSEKLEGEGDFDGAIAVLTDAIHLLPTEPWLAACRGRLFRLRKEWRKAIADFDNALAMKPDAPTTLFFRGTSRAELGEFEGAIADLESCIRIQPESADAYWQLGVIHGFLGDLESAISAYRKAFELDPNRYPGLNDIELQRMVVEGKKDK